MTQKRNWWTELKRGPALALLLAVHAGAVQATSLGDALVGAYETSGLIEQNRALLRAADEDVAIAGSLLKPIINWSGDLTRQFGNVATDASRGFNIDAGETTVALGLTAALQLYDGGADRTRKEAAKETVLATRAQLLDVEQLVLLQAVAAYFNVIRQQEFLELARNNLRLLEEELRAAQDRFDVGEVTRTDVALAEAAVASARSNLANSERDLTQAQAEYTNVVGRPPGRLGELPRLPRTESNVATAQAIAVRTHPELIQAQRQVAAADLLAIAEVQDYNPTVSLQGFLGVTDQFNSDASSETGTIGIDVTGPIYQGGLLSAQERQALANRDAARGNLFEVTDNVQQDVVDAISTLVAARESLAASEREVRAARIAFQGVREEATLGARTTLDVLDSEQNLLDAEANRISANADQYIASYAVLESMGLLTAERLGLPVQLYDPAAYYNLVKDSPAKRSRQGRDLDRVIRALTPDD